MTDAARCVVGLAGTVISPVSRRDASVAISGMHVERAALRDQLLRYHPSDVDKRCSPPTRPMRRKKK